MKIERKYMAHFFERGVLVPVPPAIAAWAMTWKNIPRNFPPMWKRKIISWDQTSVTIDSYQKQGEVAPYYAEKNDPLFEKLQAIIDGDLTLDDLKTDIVEVKLWGEASANAYPAIKEECYIEIVSYGGDTTGYQIPFNVHYTGVKTKGTFNLTTKTFTAA